MIPNVSPLQPKTNRSRRATALLAPLALGVAAAIAACAPDGGLKNPASFATSGAALTQADVDRIILQGVSQASALNRPAVIAVTDRQGEVLGVFVMKGQDVNGDAIIDQLGEGDIQSAISKAATASAFQSQQDAFTTRTAFFIVQGHFPPNVVNTAGGPLFGVQDSGQPGSDTHTIAWTESGTACGVGISGVFGGIPVFKNGSPVGGIGVVTVAVLVSETSVVDGSVAPTLVSPVQNEMDEGIARAAAAGFETPTAIQATNLFVGGIQFPFFGSTVTYPAATIAADTTTISASVGAIDARFPVRASPFAEITVGSQYGICTLASSSGSVGGQRYIGRVSARTSPIFSGTFANVDRPPGVVFDTSTLTWKNVAIRGMNQDSLGGSTGEDRYPIIDGVEPPPAEGGLTAADVQGIIGNAAANAMLSEAGIRLPRGSNVVIHIAVVDARGNILGVYRMGDGTIFSHDIAVQKARTAAFFSSDGSNGIQACAITPRAIGFISQPFFPPGIADGEPGPLVRLRDLLNRGKITREFPPSSTLISPPPSAPSDGTTDENPIVGGFQRFNDFPGGIPTELPAVRGIIGATGGINVLADRPDVGFVSPGLQTGIMTFPGGAPLYKAGKLVGAIGCSGDGVDQDDDATFSGTTNFQPPHGIRCDEVPEGAFITTVRAKIDLIVAAVNAHPDPRIRNVYGPLVQAERDRIDDRFSRGLQNVRIPYVKFPRNPTDK